MLSKLAFVFGGCTLLILGIVLVGSVSATGPAEVLLHGTPDPNATPEVTGDTIHFDEEITFYEHIQPIIAARCVSCHTGDGIGTSSLVLESPEQIQQAADQIVFVTGIRYMPPWMPSADTRPIQHDRRLSDEEIAMLDHWADDGAPLGDPATAAPLESADTVPLRRDLVLRMPEPYTPDDTLDDEYRCFVLDPGFDAPTFMTGYTIEPDADAIAHHGILYRIPASARAQADRVDANDAGLGWQCFADSGLSDEEIIGAWAPGKLPTVYPDNTGFLMQPGDFFVLQMHYNLAAGVLPDQSEVVLQLEPDSSTMHPLTVSSIMAPVELPCPKDVEGEQCERTYAIRENIRKYRPDAGLLANGLLAYCNARPEDYIDQDPAHVVSSCDREVPFDVTAIEIMGHMHQKGTAIRVVLNPDTPEEEVLLDIPKWDFHWQDGYQWVEPLHMGPGDVVRLTCEWDNTRSDNPRYIIWGEGTDDEMCLTFITLYEE